MKLVAIYARVSSEQQREERTIASQTAALIEFAKSRELEVPKEWVFEDEGYSGATLERPGLERIRDLAAEGQIQAVLVYAPDRLSRKYAYQVLLIEEFARHGVETLFVKAPQGASAEDQLLVQFQGMIAEYERAQILERSRRGKRHCARAGEISVMSGAPYGYRYIRKTDEAPAAYTVIEAEARVVQRISRGRARQRDQARDRTAAARGDTHSLEFVRHGRSADEPNQGRSRTAGQISDGASSHSCAPPEGAQPGDARPLRTRRRRTACKPFNWKRSYSPCSPWSCR